MRKFRGKSTQTGEWVYGYYWTDNIDSETHYIQEYDPKTLKAIADYIVVPETVSQSTGFKDKKRTKEYPDGQEIYGGDIVIGHPNLKENEKLSAGEVFWQESLGRFAVKGKLYVFGICTILEGINYNWEIIGDKWATPELMEEK